MEPAVQIFGDHSIKEGVGYFTNFVLNSDSRWSFKMKMLTSSLPKYGEHAKPVIPVLKDYKYVKIMYQQAADNDGKHRFLPGFEKMIADIEAATDSPPLLPLEQAIENSKQAAKDK